MNASIACRQPRPARGLRGLKDFFVCLHCAALLLVAVLLLCIFASCINEANQTATAAAFVPVPSTALGTSIETHVAALVKKEILAHPAIRPWVQGLANTARSLSGVTLPQPGTLQAALNLFGSFAPPQLGSTIQGILTLYAQDYTAAVAVQTAGTPYLEHLARGIEAGEKQAGLGEAP